MKVYYQSRCCKFLTINSFDYILTSSASYVGDQEFSVLIDCSGNVLVCDC